MSAIKSLKNKNKHKGFKSFIKGLENLSHKYTDSYLRLELNPWDSTKYAIAAIKDYKKDPNKEVFVVVASLPKIKFIKYKLQKKGVGIWGQVSTLGTVM